MSDPVCDLCGGRMPKGEEMFRYHGHSGSCPKWNDDMTTAPQDGFYVLVNWAMGTWKNPHERKVKGYGLLASYRNGAWRVRPKSDPLPYPTHWRYRPQGDFL